MPRAERCLRPSDRGILVSWLTGRIHPAAAMRLWDIIMAPSCRGEFLKKMFSISRVLIRASIMSPVFSYISRDMDC